MKKTMKKILCSLLVVVVCLTVAPLNGFIVLEITAEATDYKVGDIIQFGSYPQSEVKDSVLLAELNALAPEWDSWKSYNYYSGKGHGTMTPGDWMRYIDIVYKGHRYRGVKFIQYRPGFTTLGENGYGYYEDYPQQKNNQYYIDTVYWFKFESLKWRVINPDDNFILCETIIDAQAYSNAVYLDSNSDVFNDPYFINYANDYETSSIREWLNKDFYNTAFTYTEKNEIKVTTLNNDGYYTSIGIEGYEILDSNATNDKIFLLSYEEATDNGYGFSGSDVYDFKRQSLGSDYAKSQNLMIGLDTVGLAGWWIRTPGDCSGGSITSIYDGRITTSNHSHLTIGGVRPALKLNNLSKITDHDHYYSSEITKEATHTTEGETTYTCACGDTCTEVIAKLEDHTYTSKVTTPATHLTEGIETFTCVCGDTYTKPVDKLTEHTYTSKVTKPPSHKEEGVKTFSCACGDTYTESIAKIPHSYSKVITAPTCTAKGYTTYICSCGDSYIGDYVGTIAHSYSSTVTRPATHLTEGIRTYTCGLCGDSYPEAIAKTMEHSYFVLNIVEPTCESEGYTIYMCECGHTYNGDKKTATGHNYNGDTCVYCGESKTENCSCNCHKSGIMGLIWKILRFFYKIFGMNKNCACGVAHY